MKKKIISFILVLLTTVFLSITCFASNLPFTDVLFSQGIFVYIGDRETMNYSRDVYDNGLMMEAYTNSPGYDRFDTLTYYWRFLKVSEIDKDDILQFSFTGNFTVINDRKLSSYNVSLFMTPESAVNWDPIKIGDVKIVNSLDVDNIHYFDFVANVYHKFDEALFANENYLVFFAVNLNTPRAFNSTVMISDLEITNYSIKSSHDPTVPKYPNDSEFGDSTNDLDNAEDDILNSTTDGKTDFLEIIDRVTLLLPSISVFVTAFSGIIGYLATFEFINTLLYVSLAFGLCAFIFGLAINIINKKE